MMCMKPRNLGIILARYNTARASKKNHTLIAGLRAFDYVIKILQEAGVAKIVVSTNVPIQAKGVHVLVDPDIHTGDVRYATKMSIARFEEDQDEQFDDYTMMFGTAIFWRPSWIREAIRVIRTHKIAEVKPYKSPECCICFAREAEKKICYRLQHYGIPLDIDEPEDLQLAKEVMTQIQAGTLTYPLKEDYHEKHHVTPNYPHSEPVRLDESHYYG